MRWHTRPVLQLLVVFGVMTAVLAGQGVVSSRLTGSLTQSPSLASQSDESGLVKVQAGQPDPTCPNDAPVQYAWTENRTNMAPPKRMRYADAEWEYDSLNTTYFTRHDTEADFQQTDFGLKSENLLLRQNDPLDDLQYASNLMSSMFQYKLTHFKNAYVLKYTPAVIEDDPSAHKGNAPALEIPSKPGWPICVPTTGYDIGGGYEAMVVSVEGDRITLHIGIHEYMDGNDPALGGCPLGTNNCKGGYWVYISGITVSPDIASAYALKSGIQRADSLQREITHRIELPIVAPGKKLGTSNGNSVIVALRDSGPLIYASKHFLWGGSYPLRDDLLPANATPTVRPTTPPPLTPMPTNPTTTTSTPVPTTRPTGPPATPQPTVPGSTGGPTSPPPTTAPTSPPSLPNCVFSSDNCNNECMQGTRCTTNCTREMPNTHFCEPQPTVTVDNFYINVTFAQCNSVVCMRLSEVSNDTYNDQVGLIYWGGTSSGYGMFRLGSHIGTASSGSRRSFALNLTNRFPIPIPSFAYLYLPSSSQDVRYYIIGHP